MYYSKYYLMDVTIETKPKRQRPLSTPHGHPTRTGVVPDLVFFKTEPKPEKPTDKRPKRKNSKDDKQPELPFQNPS